MPEKGISRNIFDNISSNYYHLTVSEKKVADYVLEHREAVQFMSISELAEECGVADATVSRFCRSLQLSGYNAFRLTLAKAEAEGSLSQRTSVPEGSESEIRPEDSFSDLCAKLYTANSAALGQTVRSLRAEAVDQAVRILLSSERVFCMGQGGSMTIAQMASHKLTTIAPHYFSCADSHNQAQTIALLGEKDALLFFSYSGSTKEIVELMTLAHKNGVRIILVTRFSKSPGAALADVILQCGSNEGALQLASIPAYIAQLFIIDVLCNEIIRRSPEVSRRNQELVAEALSEKHL